MTTRNADGPIDATTTIPETKGQHLDKLSAFSKDLVGISQRASAPVLTRFGSLPMKPSLAYIFATVTTTVTLGLRLELDSVLGDHPTLVMFTVPIMFSAYLGGLRAGLLATVLSFFLATYYLLIPVHSFWIDSPAQCWDELLVVFAGVVLSVTIEALHRARRRADVASNDYQKANRELQKATALQRAIFNSTNAARIVTDAKGVIQSFNIGAQRMLGYSADEIVSRTTPADLIDPQELRERAKSISAEMGVTVAPGFEALSFNASHGLEDVYDLTYIRKDQTPFPMIVFVTALRDEKDTIIGYLLNGSDNTIRRRVEEENKLFDRTLKEKNLELEVASRMKSEFLANMSHELRTPLNSIIGFSEVLRDGLLGEMTNKQRGFINDIYGSGSHLLSLINDILDLSKVEAGKMTLDLEQVPISSLLANSLSIVREKAVNHRIHMEMDVASDLGSILVDPRKLKQIVYNLLSNAVKFSRDGGRVILRACRVLRQEVGLLSDARIGRSFPLAESACSEFLKISIIDTGIGISTEGLTLLFKPFSQIDSSLARKFEGTGLGLLMVKQLAELHGGSVAVESTPGEGSCFTVWLPFQATEEALTPANQPIARIGSLVVLPVALVVEDDYKSAELIRVHLEAEGFMVLHAASAEAALELALHQTVTLITLDILLPHMEGWEFLSRIKQIPDLARTPVVIISIVADSNKGLSLGASAVMQKPISRLQLYESLEDLGLFPLSRGQTLKILIVDDDPKAVELIAFSVLGPASRVIRAYGGNEAIEIARRDLPDAIVLDLMMPEVNGFDVVASLSERPETASIPILVVTAKQITQDDRLKLNRYAARIMEKTEFTRDRFSAEVRRAMSGRVVTI